MDDRKSNVFIFIFAFIFVLRMCSLSRGRGIQRSVGGLKWKIEMGGMSVILPNGDEIEGNGICFMRHSLNSRPQCKSRCCSVSLVCSNDATQCFIIDLTVFRGHEPRRVQPHNVLFFL